MASLVSPPQSWSSIVAASNITTVITASALKNLNTLHRHLVQLSLTKASSPAADIELLLLLSISAIDTTNRLSMVPPTAPAARLLSPPPSLAAPPARKRRWDTAPSRVEAAHCSIPGCKFKGTHPFIIKLSDTRHCHSKFPDNKIPRSIKHFPVISSTPSRGDALVIATQRADANKKKKADEKKSEEVKGQKEPVKATLATTGQLSRPGDAGSASSSTPNSNTGSSDDNKRQGPVDPAATVAASNSTLTFSFPNLPMDVRKQVAPDPALALPPPRAPFQKLPLPSSLAPDSDTQLGTVPLSA
jgi:hypothetical protein